MKIGFDAKRLFHNQTGLGNYSRTLVSDVQSFFPQNEYHLYTSFQKEIHSSLAFLDKTKYQIHNSKNWFKSYWRTKSIVSDLIRDQLDLYHGLSNELPIGLSDTKIKSIVTIHDLIFKVYPQTYPLIDRFIYDLKFRHSCAFADKILAISEHTKKDIIRFYHIDPSKIEVVYQACNPCFGEKIEFLSQPNIHIKNKLPKEYLLYVGSIETRKNLLTLIDAYQFIPTDLQLPLIVVGRGKSYKSKVLERINQLNIEHLITWLDKISSDQELSQLYQGAAAFIYPSLYEGFGIPIVEALLSKTPVITSNVSSLPEAGGPDSFYFNPLDSAEIAQKIELALTDSLKRQMAITNGYDYAQRNFSNQQSAQNMMSLYHSLI